MGTAGPCGETGRAVWFRNEEGAVSPHEGAVYLDGLGARGGGWVGDGDGDGGGGVAGEGDD